jgi:hypothetical protein
MKDEELHFTEESNICLKVYVKCRGHGFQIIKGALLTPKIVALCFSCKN